MKKQGLGAWEGAVRAINRTAERNGVPFDPTTLTHPPRDRWALVHHGVMVPGLPEPWRFFDAIVVLGTARAPVFDNRALVKTSAADSGWLLLGSGVTTAPFRPYSRDAGEWFASKDGMEAGFGDELGLKRSGNEVVLHGSQRGVEIDMRIALTPAISHFANLPGLYEHWSVLGQYTGTFSAHGESIEHDGLCTYEYARAVDAPLPMRFFTYQVLNVAKDVQVLMVEVLGPAGIPIQRTVYLRGASGRTETLTRGFSHTVSEYGDTLTTPDGHGMRMPSRFSWRIEDDRGREVIAIEGKANDDFVYGLGAGYAGSYQYEGHFGSSPVNGTGYIEWIDRRSL